MQQDRHLESLETKLAFLERASQELSDEVYRQRQEIDSLKVRLADLASRVESAQGPVGAPQDERPPHY